MTALLMGFLAGILFILALLLLIGRRNFRKIPPPDQENLVIMASQLQHKYMARWKTPLERGKDVKV